MKKKQKTGNMVLLLLVLIAAVWGIRKNGTTEHHARFDAMVAAASQMGSCEQALKEERIRRGIPLSEEDYLEIGLLGCSSSPITTTVGAPEAKRTSMLPDMAALCVRLLDEAGLKAGDRIGACYSGSFPGLNLALICAADAMDIEITYVSSIGASSYGANIPEFTSPEMLIYLYEKGLISAKPAAVTIGGEEDRGLNMIGTLLEEETERLDQAVERLSAHGCAPVEWDSYEENLRWRMELYGAIDGFVNVGGNVAGMGKGDREFKGSQGVLKDSGKNLGENSGLMERYLRSGIPVIQLLNLKQLCLEYQISYDPAVIPEIGTEGVYMQTEYSKTAIAAVFVFAGIWFVMMCSENGIRAKRKGIRDV